MENGCIFKILQQNIKRPKYFSRSSLKGNFGSLCLLIWSSWVKSYGLTTRELGRVGQIDRKITIGLSMVQGENYKAVLRLQEAWINAVFCSSISSFLRVVEAQSFISFMPPSHFHFSKHLAPRQPQAPRSLRNQHSTLPMQHTLTDYITCFWTRSHFVSIVFCSSECRIHSMA